MAKMTKIVIPESLKHYFGDKSLRTAIDGLVDKLAGDNMPETSFAEAREYNQALLMAAQVRADYVDLMFSIMSVTFGMENSYQLGNEYFDWDCNPEKVWSEKFLEYCIYRDGIPDEGGKSEAFIVSLKSDIVSLQVFRFADDDTQVSFPKKFSLEGWEIVPDDTAEYAKTKSIPVKAFIAEPDKNMSQLISSAEQMIAFLTEN